MVSELNWILRHLTGIWELLVGLQKPPLTHWNWAHRTLFIYTETDSENYQVIMKEKKKEPNTWRVIPYSYIGVITIVKISILPKLICRFYSIPIKILWSFLYRYKLILKVVWKGTDLSIVKTILTKIKLEELL